MPSPSHVGASRGTRPDVSRPRALAALIQPIARQAVGRRQPTLAALLADWPAIVGDSLAARSVPRALAPPVSGRGGGTLTVGVASADALEIQHESPRLLERINGYFGYRAVERLRLVHVARRPRAARRTARDLAPTEAAEIGQALRGVTDPALRDRLARLARALYIRDGE